MIDRYHWAIVKMSPHDWTIPVLFVEEREALMWLAQARDRGDDMTTYKLVRLGSVI